MLFSIFSRKASLAPCLRILGFMETLLQITRVCEALVFILIRFRNFPHHGLDVSAEYITAKNILPILTNILREYGSSFFEVRNHLQRW